MTLPAKWKRSSAAERRQQRAEFQLLKTRCEAAPSSETLTKRAKARSDDARARAQKKVKHLLAGEHANVHPFSSAELAKLKPEEMMRLRQHSARRNQALTE